MPPPPGGRWLIGPPPAGLSSHVGSGVSSHVRTGVSSHLGDGDLDLRSNFYIYLLRSTCSSFDAS